MPEQWEHQGKTKVYQGGHNHLTKRARKSHKVAKYDNEEVRKKVPSMPCYIHPAFPQQNQWFVKFHTSKIIIGEAVTHGRKREHDSFQFFGNTALGQPYDMGQKFTSLRKLAIIFQSTMTPPRSMAASPDSWVLWDRSVGDPTVQCG